METSKKEKVVMNYKTDDFEQLGYKFGQKLWNSRSDVNLKKFTLESSQTIKEYYDSFPKFLNSFFLELLMNCIKEKQGFVTNSEKSMNYHQKLRIPNKQ